VVSILKNLKSAHSSSYSIYQGSIWLSEGKEKQIRITLGKLKEKKWSEKYILNYLS